MGSRIIHLLADGKLLGPRILLICHMHVRLMAEAEDDADHPAFSAAGALSAG